MLSFGIIGVGHFGKHYARLLREIDGVRLVAVSSRSSASFKRYSDFLPRSVLRTTKPETIFASPGIDCVIIAAPVSYHFPLAKAALEKGKHVLVEKPMVADPKEARELAEAARKSGRVFMVGHQYLYNDYVRRLKIEIEKGTLGKIRHVFAEHLYWGPIRYDAGCFWETATHELAVLDYLFGPLTVKTAKGTVVSFGRDGRDDLTIAAAVFGGGLSATIAVSWFFPEKTRRMYFVGEKGIAVFDDCRARDKLKFYLERYPSRRPKNGSLSRFLDTEPSRIVVPKISAREPLRNEVEHFITCVRDGKKPLTDIAHGLRITEALDKLLAETNAKY